MPGRTVWYTKACARTLGRFVGEQQNWKQYVVSMLVFNLVMFVLVFVILITQSMHPLNPRRQAGDGAVTGIQHIGQLHQQYQPPALLG
ncbi:MAG: potassium-transporting ATPase subunit KdpA [Phycisphaerae bacterium]